MKRDQIVVYNNLWHERGRKMVMKGELCAAMAG